MPDFVKTYLSLMVSGGNILQTYNMAIFFPKTES